MEVDTLAGVMLLHSLVPAFRQDAGLSEVANAWEDVKDFRWHRAQKSPNWNVIPETERETDALALGTRPA